MNSKPQQPRFDVGRLNLPSDIKQVIERLKLRGLIRMPTKTRAVDTTRLHKTKRETCGHCGKMFSPSYDRHICNKRGN